MDNAELVSEVHGLQSEHRGVRDSSTDDGLVAELRELRLSTQQDIVDLLQRYASTEVPKEPGDLFLQHLAMRRDSWFVEVGQVGLIYFTGIVPNVGCAVHLIFWDKKLPKARIPAVQAAVRTCMELFALKRMMATTPSKLLATFLIKAGFTQEGCLRQATVVDGEPTDVFLLGLLRVEASWPHQMISLD